MSIARTAGIAALGIGAAASLVAGYQAVRHSSTPPANAHGATSINAIVGTGAGLLGAASMAAFSASFLADGGRGGIVFGALTGAAALACVGGAIASATTPFVHHEG